MAAPLRWNYSGIVKNCSFRVKTCQGFCWQMAQVCCYGRSCSHPLYKRICRTLISASRTSHILRYSAATSTNKQLKVLEEDKDVYRERYIPITRTSIIRLLMSRENFLRDDEKQMFDEFALALDSAIVNKYHRVLQEVKSLFDPINPDKDTVITRKWTRRERLDNEFWLLQRLDDILEKANFHRLPDSVVKRALTEHTVTEGVRVSVNIDNYDVLQFWALGKETPAANIHWYHYLLNRIQKTPLPKAVQYYKRVVVAIRLKKDSKLMLKAFKEVPVEALEMMLPDGKIKMKPLDKGILATSVSIALAGIIAKLVTVLAHITFDWMLLITGVTGLIGIRAWTVYKNQRNTYLMQLSRILYFKNVANNRGVLSLLVDRAEDESFKEALLVYSFLLTNRSPATIYKSSSQLTPGELGGISQEKLEQTIEQFIKKITGVKVEIDSGEAVELLKNFGILSLVNDKHHVLNLRTALHHLPQQPHSLVARAEPVDLAEGYDRDEYLETEEEFKEEDRKAKKYGWH